MVYQQVINSIESYYFRPEWDISEQACNSQTLVTVPLYSTLGPDSVEYVVNHSESTVIIVSVENLASLAKCVSKTNLQTVICMDPLTEQQKAMFKNISILSWKEVIEIGKTRLVKPTPPSPDQLASLIYTSGIYFFLSYSCHFIP